LRDNYVDNLALDASNSRAVARNRLKAVCVHVCVCGLMSVCGLCCVVCQWQTQSHLRCYSSIHHWSLLWPAVCVCVCYSQTVTNHNNYTWFMYL